MKNKFKISKFGILLALLISIFVPNFVARADSANCSDLSKTFIPAGCSLNLGDNPTTIGNIINNGTVIVGQGTWKIVGTFTQNLGGDLIINASTVNLSQGAMIIQGGDLPGSLVSFIQQSRTPTTSQQINLDLDNLGSCEAATVSKVIITRTSLEPLTINSDCFEPVNIVQVVPKVIVNNLPGGARTLSFGDFLYGVLIFPFIPPITNAINNLAFLVTGVSDLWLLIIRAFDSVLVFFGLKKKPRDWGTVYDSQTKQPLDPVLVQLQDAQTGKIISQAITDLYGKFGFLIQPGKFILNARKKGYEFPSKIILEDKDQIYEHVYHGSVIEIGSATDLIVPNIPMDRLGFDFNQEAKKSIIKVHPIWRWIGYLFRMVLFYFGFLLAILSFAVRHSLLNEIILAVYVLILLYQWFWPKSRLWGQVVGKTKQSVQDLVLELTYGGATNGGIANVIVARAKTAGDGKFFLKVQPGDYVLNIKKLTDTASLLTQKITVKKDGVVNAKIKI